MATIQNRSRITVTVKNRPDVTRSFSYNALDKVEAYVGELRSKGLRPKAAQGDDTKAHQVTFAHLLLRYLREFKGKSARVIAYKVESWLEDSGEVGQSLLATHRAALSAAGVSVRKATFQMRQTILNLEWIHKPLSLVKADDINGYIVMRQNQVSEATVDREVDLFSAVLRKATRSWGYHLADYPMHGVERPKYFNERDRRFKVGEEERLFAAIRKLDHEHAVKASVESMLAAEYPDAKFSSLSASNMPAIREPASTGFNRGAMPLALTFRLVQCRCLVCWLVSGRSRWSRFGERCCTPSRLSDAERPQWPPRLSARP